MDDVGAFSEEWWLTTINEQLMKFSTLNFHNESHTYLKTHFTQPSIPFEILSQYRILPASNRELLPGKSDLDLDGGHEGSR